MSQPLRAPLDIQFDYTRSLGPVLSQFMTALADRRILGTRGADGRVHAPPFEYDPVSSEPAGELTEVGPDGTVLSWSWMPEPLEGQPLTEPFAWALIRLDGADTAMLHAVDAGSAATMRSGPRVRPRWAASRVGSIRDIACFEPCDGPVPTAQEPGPPDQARAAHEPDGASAAPRPGGPYGAPTGMTVTPVRLHYEHTASPGESAYLRGLAGGRLVGQRCGVCGQVYIPPRGTCPADGVPMTEEVELPDTGTVTTFCVVNVGYPGQRALGFTPPYVAAAVLLDGADIAFQHLILGCNPDEVRMGMRVRAVWNPPEERGTTGAISHFAPADEPDAPYETYASHL
ncbi:MAG TPA: OB-fold domain-containing protein [Streptosporangiaceae bacterium]|nr:OB-fold domain-containing protein [Streptosporangiaceae bacterium]